MFAQIQQRARMVGGGNPAGGRCTVEVVVDGSADIEIRGDVANVRDLSGRQPQVRRFECTGMMPANPVDFRFRGIDGRGRQSLVRDPRNGGVAAIRIEDPQGGAEAYTFEITWSNGGLDQGRFGDRDRRLDGAFDANRVVQECQQAIRRESRDRYNTANVEFRDARVEEDRDFVRGRVDVVQGGGHEQHFQFACALNRQTGEIRSVRMDPMAGGMVNPRGNGGGTSRAMQSCQRAVTERLRGQGYADVEMGRMNIDDRPGRADWIVGDVKGLRGNRSDFFNFGCSVDLRDGDVRSVEVTRR